MGHPNLLLGKVKYSFFEISKSMERSAVSDLHLPTPHWMVFGLKSSYLLLDQLLDTCSWTGLLSPICSKTTKTRAWSHMEPSAYSKSPFLKDLELDLCTCKKKVCKERSLGSCFADRARVGRASGQLENIAWAMRNHPAEHTCSCTHPYLLSHTAALTSALPNEVPQGTCSSGSSASNTLAHTCSPRPPTQLSTAALH